MRWRYTPPTEGVVVAMEALALRAYPSGPIRVIAKVPISRRPEDSPWSIRTP